MTSFVFSREKQLKRDSLIEYSTRVHPGFTKLCLMPGMYALDVLSFIKTGDPPYEIVMVEEDPRIYALMSVEPDGVNRFSKFNQNICSFVKRPPEPFTFDVMWFDMMEFPKFHLFEAVVTAGRTFMPRSRRMVLALTVVVETQRWGRVNTMRRRDRLVLFGSPTYDVKEGTIGWLREAFAEQGIRIADIDQTTGYYHASKRSSKMLHLNMLLQAA